MSDTPVDYLARVRLWLRRFILSQASWLPELGEGATRERIVSFLMTGEEAEPAAVVELSERLGVAAAPPPMSAVYERFEVLAFFLKLDQAQRDLLWLLLAPELDTNILALYRLIWGDRHQRYATEDFVLSLLEPRGPGSVRQLVQPAHPVWALSFIECIVDPRNDTQSYRPARRLVDHLCGIDEPDTRLRRMATFFGVDDSPTVWGECEVVPAALEALRADRGRHALVLLAGGAPQTAVLTVQQLSAGQRAIVVLALEECLDDDGVPLVFQDSERDLRAVLREVRLRDAALVMTGLDAIGATRATSLREVASLLQHVPGPTFLHTAGPLPANVLRNLLPNLELLTVTIPNTDARERARLWRALLPEATAAEVEGLAAKPTDPADMIAALDVHRSSALELEAACDELKAKELAKLATVVKPTMDWDEVILPAEVKERIEEIRSFGANYQRLMHDWGLGRITTGRGIKILLSGPSGTGKTLISGLLAREMGRELYRIDIASVVSKYIGETEERLARVFVEANQIGAGILFDEADSLFARRTDVKSSVDRYANQGVNYLLQEVEAFDGLIILTTNLERSLDEAFVRRLHYHVKFQLPGPDERLALWQVHLPPQLPLDEGLELDTIANRYELTGGQIRKVVIRAAVFAMQEDKPVGLAELEAAAATEYAEQGKLVPLRRKSPDR